MLIRVLSLLVVSGSLVMAQPEPFKLRMELTLSSDKADVAKVRGKEFVVLVKLYNDSDEDVVVTGSVGLEILGSDDKPVKRSQNLGRFGRRKAQCILEALSFDTIKAKSSIERKGTLLHWGHDPNAILGWKLAEGTHTLVATWTFDPETTLARCKEKCEGHEDKSKRWNQAKAVKLEAKKTFTVTP